MSIFDIRAPIGVGGGAPPGPVLQTAPCRFYDAFDGDTYIVTARPSLSWDVPVVRLRGVDCPELGGPENDRAILARDAVVSLCLGQRVQVSFYGQDVYGRCVAEIAIGAVGNLSAWLIAEGLGAFFPDDFRLPYFDYPHHSPPWLVRHGDCVEVVDGDTLRVATHPALAYSFPVVRCARIDAPEMQGEYQGVASQALALALASGSTRRGTIAIYGSDEYGRVVADVNLQGLGSLGAVMQAAGLASWYPPSFGLGLFPGEDKHLQILTAS